MHTETGRAGCRDSLRAMHVTHAHASVGPGVRGSVLSLLLLLSVCVLLHSAAGVSGGACSAHHHSDGYVSFTGTSSRNFTAHDPRWMNFNSPPLGFTVEAWIRRKGPMPSSRLKYRNVWFSAGSLSDSDNLDRFLSIGVRESTPDSDTVAADVDKPFVGFGGTAESATYDLTVNDELVAHGMVIVAQPCSVDTPCASQWHHMLVSIGPLGGVVAGKHARNIWIDGVLVASDMSGGALDLSDSSSFSVYRVGAGGNRGNGPNSGYWMGDLDELYIFNSALVQSDVTQHYQYADFSQTTPVAWYKFAEGAGPIAFDSSPGAAHHINYGATANWESASTETPICQPKCIPGFEDDGYMATTAVVLGNTGALASSFFNTGDFCVEAWLRRTSVGGGPDNIWFGAGNPSERGTSWKYWSTGVQGNSDSNRGRIVLSTGANENIEFSGAEIPIDGNWHHIVVCSNPGSGSSSQARTAFKNGAQVGSASTSSNNLALSVGTFAVGAGAGGGVQNGWVGHIDEFFLFNLELSADQIKRHYYGDFTTTPLANIQMWLSFDEEQGAPQVVDSGGGLAMTLGAAGYTMSGSASGLEPHCLAKKEPSWYCAAGTSNDGWAALTAPNSGFTSTLPFDFNGNSFSIEVWARRTIAVPYGGTWDAETLFAVGSAYSTSAQLWMGLRNSRPALGFWDDDVESGVSGTGITTTSLLIDRAWHHYVFVVGAFGQFGATKHARQIFVDGTSIMNQVSSSTQMSLINPQIFKVGWSSSTSTLKKWVGGIDELRLWTGKMGAADAAQRYAGTFGTMTGLTLSAWYRFNEGENNAYGPRPTTAMDSIGNNHLIAATGAVFKTSRHIGRCMPPQTLFPAALFPTCAAGTANDGYISLSDHRLTATQSSNIEWANTDFTVETWIRRTAPPDGALHTVFFTVAAAGVSTTGSLVYCGFRDATHVSSPNALSISFSGDNLLSTDPAAVIVADNVWYHVACMVARAGTLNAPAATSHKRMVYKNAMVVGEDYSATRLQPSNQIFVIGKGMGASSHGPLRGDLDELYIYNEFLPRSTVHAHYKGDRSLPLRVLAYFPFNERSGLVANDASLHRNWIEADNVPKWNPPGTSSTGKCIQLCSPNAPAEGYASISALTEITASAPADFSFNASPWSMEIWVRARFGPTTDSSTQDRIFFTAGGYTGQDRKFIHCGVRSPTFSPVRQTFFGTWGDDMSAGTQWLAGDMRWKHVVLTNAPPDTNSKHARCIYIDGKAVKCDLSTGPLNVVSPRLFSFGGNMLHGQYWTGDIDEAYLWRSVLTGSQVWNHLNGVYYADRPVSAGIILAWYRFADPTDSTAVDASGVSGPATVSGSGFTRVAITAASASQCRPLEWTGFALSRPSSSAVSAGTPTFGIVSQTDQFGNVMYDYAQSAPSGQARVRAFRNGTIEAPYSPITVNFRNDLRWYTAPLAGSPPGAAVIITETVTGSVTLALHETQPSGRLPVVHSGAGTALSWQSPLLETFGFDAIMPVPYTPALTLGVRNYNVTGYTAETATIAGHVVNSIVGAFHLALNNGPIGAFTAREYVTIQAVLPASFSTLGIGLPCSLKGSALAWLPLTGGSLVDQSGRNTAVSLLNSSALTADRWGNADSAIDLTTPGQSALAVMVAPPVDNFAICAWFKIPVVGSTQVNLWVVSTALPLSAYDRMVSVHNGQGTSYTYGTTHLDMIESTGLTLSDGAWHHVCQMIKENAQPHSLWIDGSLAVAGIRSRSDFTWADRIHFGLNNVRTPTSSLVLSDIGVFERSLIASEVLELYSQTAATEIANTAHCLTVTNGPDGGYGWLMPPTRPFVLTALTVQLGEGLPLAPTYANGAITLSPAFHSTVFAYIFHCGEFNTSMRVTPTWSDPVIGQGVYAKFGVAGTAAPMPSGSTHTYILAVGSNQLLITTINGVYTIDIIRPRIIIQSLELQTTQSAAPNTVRNASAYLTPVFAAGVWPRYSAVLPFVQDQSTLSVTWSTPGGAFRVHYIEGGLDVDDVALVAGTFPVTLGPQMNSIDSYALVVYEDATPVLQVDLTIMPPALIAVEWGALQAGSVITPPLYTRSGPSTGNTIAVHGVLSTLSVTATFLGDCQVHVGGAWVGNATSGVAFDLTPSVPSANVNTVAVSLLTMDGVYTWTINSGCPSDFTCWPVPGGDPLCEFRCAWCRGATIMRICMQQRPPCCFDGSCAC